MLIEFLKEDDYAKWNKFVALSEYGTIFHTIEWKAVIEKTFGYKSLYIVFKNKNGEIVGIFPSFIAKKLFSTIIISQPFSEYGGPIVQQDFEKEAYRYIFNFCKQKIDNNDIRYVEIKTPPDKDYVFLEQLGFTKILKSFDFFLLVKNMDFHDDIWLRLRSKTRIRNSVQKAIKSGVKIIKSNDIDAFYQLYLNSIARLGSLPWPKRFFREVQKSIPSSRFLLACREDNPIAAMMTLPYKERDLAVVLAYNHKHQQYRASDLLYSNEIQYAADNKFKVIDLGRTRPNSSYEHYKRKWGAQKADLYSYIYPSGAAGEIDPYKLYSQFSFWTKHNALWKTFIKTNIGQNLIRKFP